jgi:hypothetical protein
MALAANRGDRTLAELAAHFQVPNQITQWKCPLLERAASVFENGAASAPDAAGTIRELHAKIGQLSVENDFLEGALNKAGSWSARRGSPVSMNCHRAPVRVA